MTISSLIDSPSELTGSSGSKTAIVLMTRVRLARNLAGQSFPGWAKAGQREAVLDACRTALVATAQMKRGLDVAIGDLSELERQILVERHLISRELSGAKNGAGVVISRDQAFSVMVNEEDHLRIQVLRSGFNLKKAWAAINDLDSALEDHLDFAFSPTLGYLTACPTNLGTGMRASAMMHLPALVISNQMEKVVRAVNQLGMVVRGLFGEGSDACGSIFQISNQTTLGESEEAILKRLGSVLQSIVEHELNAREKLLEADSSKLFDKIGRAYGTRSIASKEALNLLSIMKLGADLGIFPESAQLAVDELFMTTQPAHLQLGVKQEKLSPEERDTLRADLVRAKLKKIPAPDLAKVTPAGNGNGKKK